jgi:hypothetical protein
LRADGATRPLLVARDMDMIINRTNFTGAVERKHVLPLDELPYPKNLDIICRR